MKQSSADNHSHLLLTLTFVLVSMSLFTPLLGWILILVLCSTVMRLALYFKLHKHSPSARTLNLLALLSGIVLAYFSLQLGVLLGMVNLLVMACALKLMLLRNHKDFYQLIASCGFLIGCGFIFQQGIGLSVFYLLMMLLLLLALALHFSPRMGVLKVTRHILIMSLQAAPIALLLFLLLPQLGPLWQMPSAKSSQTGLSEKVTPGDIAQLSQSSELAFRATFNNANIPAYHQRYWRAMVLEQFDGASWEVAPQRRQIRRQYQQINQEFTPTLKGRSFDYEVIAQPTHQRWLFGLDLAQPHGISSNNSIWQSQEYQLISNNPIVSRFRYQVKSYPDAALNQTLFSLDSRINLQVPEQRNTQTRRWVKTMRQQYPDDQRFIQAIMGYFSEQEFVYTLQPPLMQTDPIDTFLFQQRAGFCSHYASAMAYALRLGGIPARMVTGYQGGELHKNGYVSVYQYDAHAWVEAWYDERGWQRFDPTAMVAPQRINFGLREAISEQQFLFDAPFSLAKLSTIAWLNELRLLLVDIDYNWSKWVLGFDAQKQQDLLKAIVGELTTKKLALLGLSVVLVISAMLAIYYLPNWRAAKISKIDKYYITACRILAKHGIVRKASQGPSDFALSLAVKTQANVATPFQRLTQIYVQHLYRQDKPTSENMQQLMAVQLVMLKRAVKRLPPGGASG